MEFVLLHRMIGAPTPESLKGIIEVSKKAEELVPQGKLIASYGFIAKAGGLCIWEVPSVEALVPLVSQLRNLGMETEVIPAEKMEEAIPKMEKALAAWLEQLAKK